MTRGGASRAAVALGTVTMAIATVIGVPFFEAVHSGSTVFSLGIVAAMVLGPALGSVLAFSLGTASSWRWIAPLAGAGLATVPAFVALARGSVDGGMFPAALMWGAIFTWPARGVIAAVVEARAEPTEDGVLRAGAACAGFLAAVKGPEATVAAALGRHPLAAALVVVTVASAAVAVALQRRRRALRGRWGGVDLVDAWAVTTPEERERAPVLPGDDPAVVGERIVGPTYRAEGTTAIRAVVPRRVAPSTFDEDRRAVVMTLLAAVGFASLGLLVAAIGTST